MELPSIKIPQIELPFDIPLFMHPPVDHFIIALPVVVLLLEIVNLIVKKRAIGVTAFFLLILTVVAAMAAYLTGNVDGKEAFPLLSEVAQSELKAHKLLGTYLMFASAVVVVFKLLSSMINRGLMKGLYLLVLILFVAGILKQGKEGGELVYGYGVNVQKVQNLKSELDDLKEELKSPQATEEKTEPALKEPVPKIEKTLGEEVQRVETSKAKPTIEKKPEILQEEVVEKMKDSAVEKVDTVKEKTTVISEPKEAVEQKIESAVIDSIDKP